MPSRSIIRTGVGPHREPGNRFPAMAAINLLAARAARVQSRRNLSRSLSPKLDHSHSITRFDRSRTGPKVAEVVPASGMLALAVAEAPAALWEGLSHLAEASSQAGLTSLLLSQETFTANAEG